MHIPEDKIEEVRSASDIIDVVSDYVQLKKRGSNFVGLCPFHNERTPSFNVNPAMQIYKCFGCSAGGDVFQFVKQSESVEFPESVRILADRAGITLPDAEQDLGEASETESVLHALRFAARTFHNQLIEDPGAEAARNYLSGRGVTPSAIGKFGVGYAQDSWDGLLTSAESAHVPVDVLAKAGLVIERKERNGHYDRFRGRIMFPILSHVGKVLGFGGRVMDGRADEPKYVNSPETKVYHKSRVLYGLYQARQAIRRAEEAFLVEGYTDVISLHQEGVENVVASSGTALTVDQISLLDRYCKRVVLLFDADSAGANAAVRGIDLVLRQGMAVYIVTLPDSEDPDSFVRREGGDAFREFALEQRRDFVSFKYEYGLTVLKEKTPESMAALQRSVLRSVASIPDPLVQESYMKRASDVMGIPEGRLFEAIQAVRKDRRRRPRQSPTLAGPSREDAAAKPETAAPVRQAQTLPEEKVLLRLMLEKGEPLVEFILGHMALNEFTDGPSREIASALMQMYEAEHIDREAIVSGFYGSDVRDLAAEVLVDSVEISENWKKRQNISVPQLNDDPFETASSAMTLLKLDRIDAVIESHRATIYTASQKGDDVQDLQKELMELMQFRRTIEDGQFLAGEEREA